MKLTGAADHDYDGIPYGDLRFDEVIWTEDRRKHIEERSHRKGSVDEVDIDVLWTMDAISDPGRLVRSAESQSGWSVQLLGWSPGAGRLVAVYLVPAYRPPQGTWYGATARAASADERLEYKRHQR